MWQDYRELRFKNTITPLPYALPHPPPATMRATIATIQPPCPDATYSAPFGNAAAQERTFARGFALLVEALAVGQADFCCLPEYFNVFGAQPEVRGSRGAGGGISSPCCAPVVL